MKPTKALAEMHKQTNSDEYVVASVEFVIRTELHDSVETDFVHSIVGRIIAEPESRRKADAGHIEASRSVRGGIRPRHRCGKDRRWHLCRHLRILGTSFRRRNRLSERRNTE